MTARILCTLATDPNLIGFAVNFSLDLTVSELKDAVHAKCGPPGVFAKDLTLVRIGKAGVSGLTKRELKAAAKEFFDLKSYGDDPEDESDDVSTFRPAVGAALISGDLTFKVGSFPYV